MLFLSFLASLSPFAFSRPVYIVGLVTHYSCRLGLMVFFNYSYSQFLVALIIRLFFPLGFPQMALNNGQITFFSLEVWRNDTHPQHERKKHSPLLKFEENDTLPDDTENRQ